jgi:phage tail sheath protein FI
MALFTNNPSGSGVFAQKVPAQAVITPANSAVAVGVAQFPWGPTGGVSGTVTGVEVYPDTYQDLVQMYAPAGAPRSSSAYLSLIRNQWSPTLGIVRVVGPTATNAACTISSVTPTQLFTVTAAYVGTLGNSIVITIGPASDGNTNHFNLTATLSGASGTTTEVYPNLNVSGTGADVLPPSITGAGNNATIGQVGSTTATSVLIQKITKLASGIPVQGSTTMSTGTNGTVAALEYIGTQGTGGSWGFALLEGDTLCDYIWTDDPGNSIRAAVNAGLLAHVAYMGGTHIGFINGNSGQTLSAAQTDVQSYRSPYLVYCDAWRYIYDDVTGSLQLVPSGPAVAAMATQMNPALSLAWRSVGGELLSTGTVALEQNRGQAAATNTAAGITTLDQAPGGPGSGTGPKFYLEQDVCTDGSDLCVNRMDQFIAKSVAAAWAPYVNAPQVALYQQDLLNSLQIFLQQLVTNGETNPSANAFISGFSTPVIQSTQAQIRQGQFVVASQVNYAGSMKQIIFALQSGVGITITSK